MSKLKLKTQKKQINHIFQTQINSAAYNILLLTYKNTSSVVMDLVAREFNDTERILIRLQYPHFIVNL